MIVTHQDTQPCRGEAVTLRSFCLSYAVMPPHIELARLSCSPCGSWLSSNTTRIKGHECILNEYQNEATQCCMAQFQRDLTYCNHRGDCTNPPEHYVMQEQPAALAWHAHGHLSVVAPAMWQMALEPANTATQATVPRTQLLVLQQFHDSNIELLTCCYEYRWWQGALVGPTNAQTWLIQSDHEHMTDLCVMKNGPQRGGPDSPMVRGHHASH